MKQYVCGRANLALTIQVPYDCPNTCPFCPAKVKYRKEKPSMEFVQYTMYNALYTNNLPITDVVFSGGEPTANIGKLTLLIDGVPDDKDVYINTTLLASTFDDFYKFVKAEKKIKGINISRHSATYKEDCELFHNIATDEQIEKLASITSVRINVVLYKDTDIETIVERWETRKINDISFREDFRKVKNENDLRKPNVFTDKLNNLYTHCYSTGCNVCNTDVYEKNKLGIRYHRGFESTLIDRGNYYEYNDIVIEPNGEIMLDWKYSEENKEHYNRLALLNKRESEPDFYNSNYENYCGRSTNYCDDYTSNSYNSCGGNYC